jgi:hypothetical protein
MHGSITTLGRCRTEGSCVSAVVVLPRSRSHAPLADPRLRLAADLAGRGGSAEQSRRDGDVATVSGDDRVRERAGEVSGRAPSAERLDFIVAKPVVDDTEPDGTPVDVEHGVERSAILLRDWLSILLS